MDLRAPTADRAEELEGPDQERDSGGGGVDYEDGQVERHVVADADARLDIPGDQVVRERVQDDRDAEDGDGDDGDAAAPLGVGGRAGAGATGWWSSGLPY
ncbi:hypothetical protein GCM10029992_67220 [Glycomyces albus]